MLYLLVTLMLHVVNCFTTEQYFRRERYTFKPAQKHSSFLREGTSDGNSDYRKDIDSMRSILESSWKEETMGGVPTTPQIAASNAAESVLNAMSDQMTGIFMIDISLPSLDPMSGHNVYDDIGAAEFCIEFAEKINENRRSCERLKNDGGVAIVVKDSALVSRIERLANKDKESSSTTFEFYDDFADFAGSSSLQVDGDGDLGPSDENTVSPEKIRLRSILGNNEIETGPEMINDIVRSVGTNGSPSQNEDVIVILAPISQQELVGVRWLVSKYGSSKTIIIFNNKLNPLPNELMMAETCYSVFPLIARNTSSSPKDKTQPENPKIVLLRRFPRDWEIHIDTNEGAGFELAGSVPANNVGMRGPSMDWIAGCVKQHMQLKFGQ
jgi:hypothetical protein